MLLDDARLVRAVASGRRHGAEPPPWRRVELRPVDLKAGRRLQVVAHDATPGHHHQRGVRRPGRGRRRPAARAAVRQLARRDDGPDRPAAGHQEGRGAGPPRGDRARRRPRRRTGTTGSSRACSTPSAPVLRELGIADAHGQVKPSRQAKYRQVEEMLRAVDAVGAEIPADGTGRWPAARRRPGLRQRVPDVRRVRLAERVGGATSLSPASTSRRRRASTASWSPRRSAGRTASASSRGPPWTPRSTGPTSCSRCTPATRRPTRRSPAPSAGPAPVRARCAVLPPRRAAPAARPATPPPPYGLLTRHAILRERFADVLTDALRAAVLRLLGYRVEVVEFVGSEHTPRNTLLRAVRTGARPTRRAGRRVQRADRRTWQVRPRLATLLAPELAAVLPAATLGG